MYIVWLTVAPLNVRDPSALVMSWSMASDEFASVSFRASANAITASAAYSSVVKVSVMFTVPWEYIYRQIKFVVSRTKTTTADLLCSDELAVIVTYSAVVRYQIWSNSSWVNSFHLISTIVVGTIQGWSRCNQGTFCPHCLGRPVKYRVHR